MEGFICLKALRLGETDYRPGDSIPQEAVLPRRVPMLMAQKYLARAAAPEEGAAEPAGEPLLHIPIVQGEDTLILEMPPWEVEMAVELVQRSAKAAVERIASMESEELLILIDTLDPRKTVKEAARARAEKRKEPRGEGGDG